MISYNHDADATELELVYDDLWHASAHVERLIAAVADQQARVEALEAALRCILTDPHPTLDEPDTDVEIILKYRDIARAALAEGQDK